VSELQILSEKRFGFHLIEFQ